MPPIMRKMRRKRRGTDQAAMAFVAMEHVGVEALPPYLRASRPKRSSDLQGGVAASDASMRVLP